MATIFLFVLLFIEIVFLSWSMIARNKLTLEKKVARIAVFMILLIVLASGVFIWSFRYYSITLVLGIQAIWGIVVLIRKPNKPYSLGKALGAFLCSSLLFVFSIFPAVLFPQYKPISQTGSYTVVTEEHVWIDQSRIETFTDTGENRLVNVSFWYPEEIGKYPLVVFSHGAFGVAISNESTFRELASNGYVVASIGHPYHSFYTLNEQGAPIVVNTDFMNSVLKINEIDDGEEKQAIIQGWMETRLGDINFVLDEIISQTHRFTSDDSFFGRVNIDKIGLLGHSLGGAASAQIARERNDIDAVVLLDATMLGEVVGFDNGKQVLDETPYPVPLFNIYRQAHYESALPYGELYENFHAAAHAISSYEVIFKNAGHMSFTDLTLFSPILAGLLEVSTDTASTADARYVIETMNQLIQQFFDYTLKAEESPHFEKEY